MEYKDWDAAALRGYNDYNDHFRVRQFMDAESGLNAFIAVHNKNLGPALGGCRMYPYGSEGDALRDVLRLSYGMTYKNALAGLPLGGGKSVIIGDPATDKTEALMEAMGRAVHMMDGDYVSAEDSGTSETDMALMRRATPYVMGQKTKAADALGGDPSPVTAYGVFCGLKAALRKRYGRDNIGGLHVAVQGLGAVGYELCRLLDEQGAELFVTDMREDVLQKAQDQFTRVQVVGLDEIFSVPAQVFAPCALGAQLNAKTIPEMNFDIIAGAANNQLETPEDDDRLAANRILYTPDYVVNAAGVIAVGYEYFEGIGENPFPHELTRDNMLRHVERIGDTIDQVFALAESRGITPGRAADEMAEDIFMANNESWTSSGTA